MSSSLDVELAAQAEAIAEDLRDPEQGAVDISVPATEPPPTRRTPLPKIQWAIFLYLQLAEPLTCTVIYPFINQLVQRTGITGGDEKKTGYYAGLTQSLFYAAEAICVLQWGRLSDRIGRRPVLLTGLFGLTLAMFGFGLSRTYWEVALSRIAQGLLNGNIGVVKSMMAEITDRETAAFGFALFSTMWSVGTTVGPLLGGVLADPATRWPDTFGRHEVFVRYPYFLPCVAVACMSISAFVLTFIGLPETLQVKRRQPVYDPEPKPSLPVTPTEEKDLLDGFALPALPASASAPAPVFVPPPGFKSLLNARFLFPLLNMGFIAFVDQCFEVLQPLVYSTSISAHGLGMSTFEIGLIIGVWGAFNCIVEIFVFPRLVRKMGPRRLYIIAFACYLAAIAAYPLLAFLAGRAGRVDAWTWAVLVLQLGIYAVACMGYGCIFVFVNDAAPVGALGLANGFAQSVASTMRAIAPVSASSLFAITIEKELLHGTMVWWILCAIVIAGIFASFRLPKQLSA